MSERIYPLKLYLKSRYNLIVIILCLVFNLLSLVWLILQIKPQVDPIFLHYNILFGVDFIGPWWQIFFLPAIGSLILIINTVLSWLFFQKDKFGAYLLLGVALLCEIFLFIATVLLVFLNV